MAKPWQMGVLLFPSQYFDILGVRNHAMYTLLYKYIQKCYTYHYNVGIWRLLRQILYSLFIYTYIIFLTLKY